MRAVKARVIVISFGALAPAQPPQPPPAHNGQAFWLKVSARDDGSFTVTNARNGFVKTYAARPK